MSDPSNAAGTMMWDQPEQTEANAALSPASIGASKAAEGFSAESGSGEQDDTDAANGNNAESSDDPSSARAAANAAAAAAAAQEFDLSGINSESTPPTSSLLDLMAPSDAFLATSHPHSHHNASSAAAAAAAAAAQAARDDPFGLSTLSGNASSTTSNVSSPGPSSPQSAKGTARHSANHSGSKAAPGSSPMAGSSTNSAGLPAGMPSLSVSSSQDILFSAPSEASPVVSSAAPAASTTANPTGASAKPEKTVTGRLLRMFNPFSSSGSATAAGAPAPVGSPSTQPMPAPSPPPSAPLGAPAATSGLVSPTTPFTPFVSSTTVSSSLPSSASSAALSAHQSPGGGALQLGAPIVPKSYSYQDFAAKMKLPGAQDLVKTLKNYVKQVQSPEWFAAHASHPSVLSKSSTEFDRIRTEYNDTITSIMRLIRTKHPLWKGASEEEIDNSLESIEKFLTSKLYERFFPGTLFPQDRIQDAALADKLFKLHTWVRPAHLDLPAYCCADPSIWDHPSEELRNMDKFKSPRDKLVCLLNCCHIINNILKRAKQKENAEKAAAAEARRKARAAERERVEREREKDAKNKPEATTDDPTKPTVTTDAASTEDLASPPPASSPISPPSATANATAAAAVIPPGGSLSSARRLSLEDHMVPSSSPSADDFFPALIYTLIHARPPHLYLNLVYISLCRYESKLSGGEAAYWYTNLASAIQFVENCSAKSFSFGKTIGTTTATAANNATETDANANATATADKSTSHRKGASGSTAASALAAEEARAEYQRLMDQGEVLLREQRAAEAAEAAEVTRKADAAAAASAAAAEAKRVEEAESEAAAANAAVFMSAAAIDVMPPVPSAPSATVAPSAGPAVASAAAPSASVATSAAGAAPASAFEHNHGPSSWPPGSSSALSGYLLPPPCIACLQLSHRRFAPRFLDREFSDLRVSELQDVLREYKEMCFLIQGWQDHAAHKELRNMPLPARREHAASNAQDREDGEGVALSAADASSAAPSSAHVAASSTATAAGPSSHVPAATSAAPPLPPPSTAAPLGSWPLTNFLGLGMGRSKKG